MAQQFVQSNDALIMAVILAGVLYLVWMEMKRNGHNPLSKEGYGASMRLTDVEGDQWVQRSKEGLGNLEAPSFWAAGNMADIQASQQKGIGSEPDSGKEGMDNYVKHDALASQLNPY